MLCSGFSYSILLKYIEWYMVTCVNFRLFLAFVSFFFLAPDQWPLPVLWLSCNYTTVWGIWVFKRSNNVSILSQGTDLRRVSHLYKRSLALFWCHTNSFASFFWFVFFCSTVCLTFIYGEWASKMPLPLRCDYWEEDGRWNRSRRWDKYASK